MIHVDHPIFLIAALLLLLMPLDWLMAAITASVFHEICHILVLYALKGSISRIHIKAGGCVIQSVIAGPWREAFSILAGPLGSFLLLFTCRITPKIAICGLFQGLYNLIPILPLDGGRLLRLVLYQLCPESAERVLFLVAAAICLLTNCLVILAAGTVSDRVLVFLLAAVWSIRFLPRKIPCKPTQSKVQ